MTDDPASRIVAAATELFAEHGYDGVGVRAIAKQADVTVGSINYYFGPKDSLYRECARRLTLGYLAEAEARLGRDGPKAVLEHYAEFAVRDPRVIQFWLDLQRTRDPEKREFANREILQPIQALLERAMDELGERTLERKMKMLCFVGAVALRSRMTDEQLGGLTDVPADEAHAVWLDVLFENLLDE